MLLQSGEAGDLEEAKRDAERATIYWMNEIDNFGSRKPASRKTAAFKEVLVTVMYNEGEHHYSGFDAATASLTAPFTVDVDRGATEVATLENVWAALNRGSGQESVALDGRRSMSVGDVAMLDGNYWAVSGFGWDPISQSDASNALFRDG
jgi:hypothetical protein